MSALGPDHISLTDVKLYNSRTFLGALYVLSEIFRFLLMASIAIFVAICRHLCEL